MRAHRLLVSSFMLALVAALLAYPVIATQDIQPVSGRQQTLAIVVEFSDVKHTEDKASIDALIFGQVSGYYADVSYGKIQIVGKTVGWYTLPHNMSYYGEDIDPTYLGSDARPMQLIRDAVEAAQDSVNFNDYSRIIIVHAGMGQEDAVKDSNLIWSEAYYSLLSISTKSGTTIHSAAILPEMEARGHSSLGVYAHEYGHLLSLPDLYELNNAPGAPDPYIGVWSLMGAGVWLGNPRGSSPAELEAWSRIKLGWLTPDIVDLTSGNLSAQLFTLTPLETSMGIRAVNIPSANGLYYLLEYRRKIDFDRYLPQEGLLVTRIDESKDNDIVQVMDASSSTRSLSDATYSVGDAFDDPKANIFVKVLTENSSRLSVLVSNQNLSSFVLTPTRIAAPRTVNATSSEQTVMSARLTDDSGNSLTGLPVRLQYYNGSQWNELATTVTDNQGNANFAVQLSLNPGQYQLRFPFTGENIGNHYLLGSDQVATFNVKQSFSDWVYPIFGIVVLVALTASYVKIRRRRKYELSTVP